jgi:endonuclease-3 related protein
MEGKIYQLYLDLLKKHGAPVRLWPQWCAPKKSQKLKEIIALGAILTQRTSWRNAHLALQNLKKGSLLSLEKIAALKNLEKLKTLIRPAGFYQTKPRRLFELAKFFKKQSPEKLRKENLQTLRQKLLSLFGIGPETADVILLYVLSRPSFVIDEYTRRLVKAKNLSKDLTYDHLKKLFEKNLPKNIKIYQNYHALIIIDQRGRTAAKMEIV